MAKFRQVFDSYLRAPGEILDALLPDMSQVETRRPLRPLWLPIHHERERDSRLDALRSRAGMINLYLQLLELRISFGTLTRFVRRMLGMRAAQGIRGHVCRVLVILSEVGRMWWLVGKNIHLMAPLIEPLVIPLLKPRPPAEAGATADQLLFRSPLRFAVFRAVTYLVLLLILAFLWLLVFAIATLPFVVAAQTLAHGVASLVGAWDSPLSLRRTLWKLLGLAMVAGFVTGGVLRWRLRSVGGGRGYLRALLARYDLANSLFSPDALRRSLVGIFDPEYYGDLEMDDVVRRALQNDDTPSTRPPRGKLLADYASAARTPAIHVGLTVADVCTGKLRVLPSPDQDVKVVDGLLAATAVAPLFPPQDVAGNLYLDGTNVANEPTRSLLNFIRPRVNPESKVIHLYSVLSLPISEGSLEESSIWRKGQRLVDVVLRAFQLQRFRDATLERRLIELYTRVIPSAQGAKFSVERPNGSTRDYLRAWVFPIEPEAPLEVNARLLASPSGKRRRELIARTVADGCRAALEAMILPQAEDAEAPLPDAAAAPPNGPPPWVRCRNAVDYHLDSREAFVPLGAVTRHDLPGSRMQGGPGIVEVCDYCAIRWRPAGSSETQKVPQSLRVRSPQSVEPPEATLPVWPHELEEKCKPLERDPHLKRFPTRHEELNREAFVATAAAYERESTPQEERWPRPRDTCPGASRPLVSLLFSGGVFRGVHQMGVLNALSEADVHPDVVAGASVGSITAALVAQTFLTDPGPGRDGRIARLAATYLGMDRLILTDRFADFIRNLTLRAADTPFSLRQADRLFRRYDMDSTSRFGDSARMVVAGLERLFYISPFELKALVQAIRARDNERVLRILRGHLQELLNRMGVENQVLGAEPLALIVTEHVLKQASEAGTSPELVPFDVFLQKGGIYFLATATNLTKGRLEILGEQQPVGGGSAALLLEGLLASSAFPGVFRPRWGWEIMPTTRERDQYIDGGVMDNIPLDAVAEFLFEASRAQLVEPRPAYGGNPVPHLLFAASLQPDLRSLDADELQRLRFDWPALFARARTLSYNKKLDLYRDTQRDIRAIWNALPPDAEPDLKRPLDLEVVTVRPRWLCGTFAFHPMLGFRRAKQAASIAHGCAATLLRLGKLQAEHPDWAEGWGLDAAALPSPEQSTRKEPFEQIRGGKHDCWYRPGIACPFSQPRLRAGLPPLSDETMRELEAIYQACGRSETHRHA